MVKDAIQKEETILGAGPDNRAQQAAMYEQRQPNFQHPKGAKVILVPDLSLPCLMKWQ